MKSAYMDPTGYVFSFLFLMHFDRLKVVGGNVTCHCFCPELLYKENYAVACVCMHTLACMC